MDLSNDFPHVNPALATSFYFSLQSTKRECFKVIVALEFTFHGSSSINLLS